MNIGVFDSGRGGEFMAERLEFHLPQHTYRVVNDSKNVPYGSRTQDEIVNLTEAAIQPLLESSDIIVIACNTATMAGINILRQHYPHVRFVGTEPMIKPAAALTAKSRVTMLATPLTMRSQRYIELCDAHGQSVHVDEPYTQHWATQIERHEIEDINFEDVAASVQAGSDVIVLACTHYLALQHKIAALFPDVSILEPSEAIARQIDRLVRKLDV